MEKYYIQLRSAVHRVTPITQQDWDLCKPLLIYKSFKKGDFFAEAGKTYHEIAFLLKGVFRAYYIKADEEMNCNFFFEGQWPKAYHSFLTKEKSKIWVQAMEDAEVFLLSYKGLQSLFEKSKNWERFGRLATENSFVNIQERYDSLLLNDPETRYRQLQQHHPEIMDRIPLYHIASYLGIRQPSLSRIRRRLAKKHQK